MKGLEPLSEGCEQSRGPAWHSRWLFGEGDGYAATANSSPRLDKLPPSKQQRYYRSGQAGGSQWFRRSGSVGPSVR